MHRVAKPRITYRNVLDDPRPVGFEPGSHCVSERYVEVASVGTYPRLDGDVGSLALRRIEIDTTDDVTVFGV